MLKKQNYHYLRTIYPRIIILFLSFLVFHHETNCFSYLSKDEKQRINQQQLYRLLRKLVKQGYLIKNIHLNNPRLSTFVETKSMATFRKQFEIKKVKSDPEKLGFKTKQLKEKQKIYENQIKASEQALADFPELKTDILRRKSQLL